MKVVIDTNVLISLLFGKTLKGLKKKIKAKEFNLIISPELLTELVTVLERPKFRMLSEEDKKDLFFIIEEVATMVYPAMKISACRDPKDNIILECAVAGKVDYIISGDPDLLVLNPYQNIKIVTPKSFSRLVK